MRILSLCDYTGNMVRPWIEAGHEAVIVDLQHPPGETRDGLLTRVGANILEHQPDGHFDAVFAFPPCTDLAVSGALHFKAKGPERRNAAMDLVYRCRDIAEALTGCWMLENPVSVISTEWREPDFIFDPYAYGGYVEGADRYTKKTCLWVGSDFRMPYVQPVSPTDGSKMHRVPPGPNRQNIRSATPMGFARAVFEANALGLGVRKPSPLPLAL
jgi:hypothetical protein